MRLSSTTAASNPLLRRARGLLALLPLLLLPAAELDAEPEPGRAAASPETGGLSLEVATENARVYLHEPVQVTVTLSGPLQPRNVEYPRLAGSGFSTGEFSTPRPHSTLREGQELWGYQFSATVTPTKTGTLLLGPAQLRCELPAPGAGPDAFFGVREARRVTLRSETLPLTVLALPAQGRPPGFTGAVGRFTVARTARPAEVASGEPVTVRTVIRGQGNIAALSCLPIVAPGVSGYAPVSRRAGDTLTCEQVIIPQSPAVREIPAAEVAFFDPARGGYRSAQSRKIPLRVSAIPARAPSQPVLSAAQPSAPPRTLRPARLLLPVAAAAGILLALGGGVSYLWRGRRRGSCSGTAELDPAPALRALLGTAEAALLADDAEAFYTAAFRLLQAGCGSLLQLPAAGITAPPAGETGRAAPLASARTLFSRCDRVRYGKHRPGPAEMSADLQLLREMTRMSSS